MTDATLDNLRRDRAALEAELTEADGTIKGTTVKCPFHDDCNASAQIYQADDGAWRLKCHASTCGFSGDLFDVRAQRTGKPLADVLRDARGIVGDPGGGRPTKATDTPKVYPSVDAIRDSLRGCEAVYTYADPDTGRPDLIVFRLRRDGGKSFMQARPEGDGFVLKAPPKLWPIYNRRRIQDASEVVVVEGEKDVHALHEIGIVAATSPAGAGKAGSADWTPLAGKVVFLWPDSDEPGLKHMKDVAKVLEGLSPPCDVHWIDPGTLDLPEKGDASDFLDGLADCSVDEKCWAVRDVLGNAEPLGVSSELADVLEQTITGQRTAIPWPWAEVSRLSKALLPGTVTLICGDAGSGKSFLLLQAAAHWHQQGVPIAVYELEEDRAYHLNRALAQADENSNLLDDDWVRANPEEARRVFERHKGFLDGFGRTIWAAREEQVALDELAEWAEALAKSGCRVICIDPVTAAAQSREPWVADAAFLARVKTITRETNTSVILVTHPKKGRKNALGLDELAGGAAYARFSQCILWLQRHDVPKEVIVRRSFGDAAVTVNRSLHIVKSRNGFGGGLSLGFDFDGGNLLFAEQGVIRKDS